MYFKAQFKEKNSLQKIKFDSIYQVGTKVNFSVDCILHVQNL